MGEGAIPPSYLTGPLFRTDSRNIRLFAIPWLQCPGGRRPARRVRCHAKEAVMAFAQNIVVDHRRCVHGRARGHGGRVRPGRAAVDFPSPSSGCRRTEPDPGANGQRFAIARSVTHSHDGCRQRSGDRCRGPDGFCTSQATAHGASDRERNRYSPDPLANDQPTSNPGSIDSANAIADR